MTELNSDQILALNPEAHQTEKSQTGWAYLYLIIFNPLLIIFNPLLIIFNPLGWYIFWKKTHSKPWKKVTVILLMGVITATILIETQLVAGLKVP